MNGHLVKSLCLLACLYSLVACQPVQKMAGTAQVSPKYDHMAANIQQLFTQDSASSCLIHFMIDRKSQKPNQLIQNKRYNPMTLKLIVKATGTCHRHIINQSWYQEIHILNDSSDLSQIDQSARTLWRSMEFKTLEQIRDWLKQSSNDKTSSIKPYGSL